MNIDELTIGEAKKIAGMFSEGLDSEVSKAMKKVGDKVFIRTLTYHYIGRVIEETPAYIKLGAVVWVADSGQFTKTIQEGSLSEIEIIDVDTYIMKSNIVDVIEWRHPIPTQRK